MGALDELSVEIGRLKESNDTARQERAEIRQLLTDLNRNMTSLTIGLASATATLTEMKPKVEETVQSRWLNRGIITGIALGGGALGGKAAAFLGWFGGK